MRERKAEGGGKLGVLCGGDVCNSAGVTCDMRDFV